MLERWTGKLYTQPPELTLLHENTRGRGPRGALQEAGYDVMSVFMRMQDGKD